MHWVLCIWWPEHAVRFAEAEAVYLSSGELPRLGKHSTYALASRALKCSLPTGVVQLRSSSLTLIQMFNDLHGAPLLTKVNIEHERQYLLN